MRLMGSAGLQRAGSLFFVFGVSAVVGAAIASSLATALVLVALAVALIAVVGALTYPEGAFIVLVLLLALVPTYAAPDVGHLLFMPAAGAAWLLAGVLAWRQFAIDSRPFRVTGIDIAVGIFALLMAISVAFSAQVSAHAYLELFFTWGGMYLAARLLLRESPRPVFLMAVSFALATVIVAPVAILETAGKSNPFFALQFNAEQAATWAKPASRFGQIRAEASFGHPIALSMFAATSALMSLAMAIGTENVRNRVVWFLLAIVGLGVQGMTLSRTGWIILGLGIILLTIAATGRAARRRLVGILSVLAVALGVLFATSLSGQTQLLASSGIGGGGDSTAGSSEVQKSGAGRTAELDRALQPGILQAWGTPVNRVTPAVESTGSTDNEYILLAEEWGLIPMAALMLVGVALLAEILRCRSKGAGDLSVLPIAAFASLVALFLVAFITQQQLMIWLLLGSSGAIAEKIRLRSRKTELPPSLRRQMSSWDRHAAPSHLS